MAKTAGKFCSIYWEGIDLTGYSSQFEINLEFAEDDITGFQDGCENSIPDMPKMTGTLSALLDGGAASHNPLKSPGSYANQYLTVLIGANAAPVIGDPALMLPCHQFTFTTPLAIKTAVKADCKFATQGDQPDINGIVLANTTITATTNFTSVDNTALTSLGAAAVLHVMLACAADTYVVKVQHSTNNVDWVDLLTFALNGSAVDAERQATAVGVTTVNRYLRAQATRTGAAGNPFKLCVAAARH